MKVVAAVINALLIAPMALSTLCQLQSPVTPTMPPIQTPKAGEALTSPGPSPDLNILEEVAESTATPDVPSAIERPPAPISADGQPKHTDLHNLVPDIEDYLKNRQGRVGIAVFLPSSGILYSRLGDQSFQTASVIKVVIMAAITHMAAQDGRGLSEEERSLLESMITWSDNDAADVLWYEAGNAAGIGQFLAYLGIDGIQLDQEGFWGDSLASPEAMALFLAKITWNRQVDQLTRQTASELMSEVSPLQAWGITAGIPPELTAIAQITVKNGWYPRDDGWVVNSSGTVHVPTEGGGYSIVVMTDGQPTLDYAIETIEAVASMIHQRLLR